jgi:hypothetical protein
LRIKATLLMLFALLAVCHAQLKVTLSFESAAPREVFVASALPKNAPSDSVKASGQTLDYSVPAFGGSDRIYVWDHSTNNIASKPIKDISNGAWAVKAADYNLIGAITIRIEHKGQPVQAASVKLTSKGKTEDKLLDPTGKGDVQFFGYPAGDLRVKVSYNTIDKKQASTEQVFPAAVKRDSAEPIFTVSISDEVATGAASSGSSPAVTAPGTAAPGQKPPADDVKVETGSPVTKLFILLIALVLIGGAGYFVFNMVKNDPKKFESQLQKLGVQIPTQQDPNAGTPIAVTPLAPAPPPPKIMLDDSDPTPLGVSAAPVVSPIMTMSGGEPTLVKESGERFTLSEGETEVGREDGLGISLVGESTVSRKHASISRSGKTTVVKDLGSTNGTFVNGTRLQGETTLKPGDQVQFGSIRFRYEG